ncbi:MAG: RidA family protein [Pseudomonadota bacterium]
MKVTAINSDQAPAPAGTYENALLAEGVQDLLFISGQVPVSFSETPADFAGQAAQVWTNIDAQLQAAGMSKDNLVKATTFLADRSYAAENRDVRSAYLGDKRIALTVVVCEIFDSDWLIEVEAIAAR